MKPISVSSVITFVFAFFFCSFVQAQTLSASAVWISDCNQSNYYNTSGLIGPAGNVFTNTNFGTHTKNSHTLIFRGGEVRTSKIPGVSNVCSAHLYYRIYPQSGVPGAFTMMNLVAEDCDVPNSQFPSGGSCSAGDQKWSLVLDDGTTVPYSPVDLTTLAPDNYTLEVYYDITGSSSNPAGCDETVVLNNGGANYKASFSIQSPSLASANPTTCNGTEGFITISGLTPGASYSVSYTDDGSAVGPANKVANASGEILLTGLNAGIYSDFELVINGCTTNLNTGLILSNPVIIPKFNKIPAFCAGTTAPTLPATSLNGITGTWNPAVINNQTSGSYTFTPDGNQCGIPATINVTVTPRTIPTFSFGTSLSICAGGSVPTLPGSSLNGITGTWNPAVVDNQNSATYTFTPSGVQCASPTTLTVTVAPNITPTFSFGTTLTICAGAGVPTLPTTSDNGINGTWSPSAVDNQNSGTYTFTPSAGQCATTTTFDVTVNPNVTPVFSFGTSLTICNGGSVPILPSTSDNGITGTWNPSTVSNLTSGVYTFTPSAGICAPPVTFTVTVAPNITPAFSFGSSLTICAGNNVPALPNTSNNGIIGTWNPAVVDDQNSGTYTFTPDAGQCATSTTFTVTVNPNITPVFSFGNSLTICEGSSVPSLPATSDNGITGTWSPATVDNQNSGTYTFTPSGVQCALPVNFVVTVNPKQTPVFGFGTSLSICAGGSVPSLSTTSDNGITGTWSPSVVNDQSSGVYTFTPDAPQCANSTTFTVTVAPNITPTFSFGTSLTICAGGSVPSLPATSDNGITGTWSPSTVDDLNSGTYTFTPDAGQCATTTVFNVTVNPNVTPVFNFGTSLSICGGGSVPALPSTSDNGINGTWNPAVVDNQNSATYTFTPSGNQCALSTTFTVTVNSNTAPTFSFGTTLTICAGAGVPTLPTTSDNGINGTWSPSAVDNQNSGTYTFTPSTGQCATSTTFTVTVNPNITPVFSFGTSLSICDGGIVPALPATSTNGITGTWNPAVVDNQNSGTYIFTPDAGQCAVAANFVVTVNPILTPTFSFGTSLTICASTTAPALPAMSTNGISGIWSPSSIDNQNSGTYTFTPDAGQCATTTSLTVTVNPNIAPTFSFGTTLTICAGSGVPALPTTSDNAITGTWSPSVVDNQNSGTYTFTPDAGQCATSVTFTVTVNPIVTPAFGFGTSLSICTGGAVPTLPNTSSNGITGTWSPAVVDNQNSGTYTFTPDAGQCTVGITFTVTVNSYVTPTFSIGSSLTICQGSTVPVLPTTSDNGITGTWSPSVVNNQTSRIYAFTADAGQCANSVNFDVTVTPNTVPAFSFGTSLVICAGDNVPTLPTTSDNGLTGSWSPSTVSNQTSAVYTFTPDPVPGECLTSTNFIVTVNQNVTPTFNFGSTMSICTGSNAPALPTTSSNGITGAWSPAVIDNQTSGSYIFTPDAGQCAGANFTLAVTVTPVAVADNESDTTVTDGAVIPGNVLSGTPSGVSFSWTNSNTAIGLGASGTGNVPTFIATNKGQSPVKGTITVTPAYNGCSGTAKSYVITVIPLDKDIFVPNVFTPNDDGKNDILYAYGNYIDKLEMRIFNQYGQQVQLITDPKKGWDGKYKGTPQPVGVYMYVLKATLTDGRSVQLKGNITLLR